MSTAGTVQIRYRLWVTQEEADVLYHLFFQNDCIPSLRSLPYGSRTRLGGGLWGVMKAHGLISTTGIGHATTATVHHDAFDRVQFMVTKKRRVREARWEDVPEGHRSWRFQGSWINDLHGQLVPDAPPSPALQNHDTSVET